MRVAWALVLLAVPLAGCAALEPSPIREISGPTEGYTPTPSFLKLEVRREDGSMLLLDFDRADWYTAEIARRVDLKKVEFVSAQAKPRDILNEYLAQSIAEPADLQSLRYDDMGASAESRQSMDAEHTALLQEWMAKAPIQPTQLLPADALP